MLENSETNHPLKTAPEKELFQNQLEFRLNNENPACKSHREFSRTCIECFIIANWCIYLPRSVMVLKRFPHCRLWYKCSTFGSGKRRFYLEQEILFSCTIKLNKFSSFRADSYYLVLASYV